MSTLKGKSEIFKPWFAAGLAVICAAGGYFVYGQGADSGVYRYAERLLESQTKAVVSENRELADRSEEERKTVEKEERRLAENEEQSAELSKYYDEIDDYEAKSTELASELETAKTEHETLSAYAAAVGSISNEATGEARKLEDGTYECPDDISAGRYKFTGTGMFRTVERASNKVTDSQNLKNLDGNSYTMNIESDMRIITEGDVTITPVK